MNFFSARWFVLVCFKDIKTERQITSGPQYVTVLLEKYIISGGLSKLEHKCLRCFKWHTWVPKCSILSLVMLDCKDMSSHIWDTLYFICNGQTGSDQEWMPQIHCGGAGGNIVQHFSTPLYSNCPESLESSQLSPLQQGLFTRETTASFICLKV